MATVWAKAKRPQPPGELIGSSLTIEITDRGRPVAVLALLPEGSALERLRKAGVIDAARGSLDDLPAPLVSRAGGPPSRVLARLRADER